MTHPSTVARAAFSLAVAFSAANAAAQQAQPQTPARPVVRVLDETETFVRLWTPSPSGGYVIRLETIVYGVTGRADATQMVVKQNGRALVTQRCAFGSRDDDAARLSCATPDTNLLTATGELTIELSYIDDENDRTEALRTFVVQARKYPDWIRGDGRRVTEWGGRYQILAHDALGTAWLWHTNGSSTQTEAHETQQVRIYTAFAGDPARFRGSAYGLRCTVNGTRIPDIEARVGSVNNLTEVSERPNLQDTRMVQWNRTYFEMQQLWWGRRIPFPASRSGYNTTNTRFMAEHVGAWSCDLRMDGQVLRTFAFTVGADGRVGAHAEQSGAQGYRQLGGLSLIEVRLPANSPADEYIDPAAIRASFQYGQPRRQANLWTNSFSTLPARATGNAEPTPVAGGARPRGRGRR